jgi:hypothetical protein
MNRYLQALLIFDVAAPAFLIGLPCCALFWAVLTFQNFVLQKTVERDEYETKGREVTALSTQLAPTRAKVLLLKSLLSTDDIETRLDRGIAYSLEKFSSDEVEQTLHDYQTGPSVIGQNLGEGRRLSLKLSSRWESLNTATADWETRFPTMILESLSIDLAAGSAVSVPYLQSTLTYFVVTEN